MKKLVFIFLLSTFIIQAQKINQFDANNKRHGIWQKKHKNGKIRYKGQFKHGKEIGVFKFYSIISSKHPVIIKKFNEHNNISEVSFYTPEGILESKGTMKGKNRIGQWIYFHKDGKTIMQKEHYKNNLLNGEYLTFYPTGKPTVIANYKNGKLNGVYKKFSVKNKLYQKLTYENGVLHGPAELYDRVTGLIYEQGNYVNDEKLGVWKYYIDGEFTHSKELKKSKYHK